MKNFYIFLDIDGVLWDWSFFKSNYEGGYGLIDQLNPESIAALNFFIKQLSNKFNVNLVISSNWRSDMEMTKKTLFEHGLIFKGEISKTDFINQNRQVEIENYLKTVKENKNFVIIDDDTSIFTFPKEKIIKTNIVNGSLNINQIKEFLNKLQIEKSFE